MSSVPSNMSLPRSSMTINVVLPTSSMIAKVSVLRSSMTFNIFNLLPRSSITMRTMLGGWLATITSGVKRRMRGSRKMVVVILQLALSMVVTNCIVLIRRSGNHLQISLVDGSYSPELAQLTPHHHQPPLTKSSILWLFCQAPFTFLGSKTWSPEPPSKYIENCLIVVAFSLDWKKFILRLEKW